MTEATCSNCRFALTPSQYDTRCRRFPPQVVVIHVNRNPDRPWPNCDHDSMFPVLSLDAWCGEHKPIGHP